MTEAVLEATISAALDGERVDLSVLRRALAQENGRTVLASFVLLRAATAADPIEADERVAARTRATLLRRTRGWFAPRHLAVAASVAAMAVAASFWLGAQWQRAATSPSPTPGVAVAEATRAPQPPSPTRMLQFQPGVDWRDGE